MSCNSLDCGGRSMHYHWQHLNVATSCDWIWMPMHCKDSNKPSLLHKVYVRCWGMSISSNWWSWPKVFIKCIRERENSLLLLMKPGSIIWLLRQNFRTWCEESWWNCSKKRQSLHILQEKLWQLSFGTVGWFYSCTTCSSKQQWMQ